MTNKKLSEASRKALEIILKAEPMDVIKVLVKNYELQPKDACKTALNLLKHSLAVKKVSDRELTREAAVQGFGPDGTSGYPISKKFRFNSEKNDDHLDEKQRFAKEKGEKYEAGLFQKLYQQYKNKNDPFLFAHFTNEIPETGGQIKVGLNPRSDPKVASRAGKRTETFNTPLGVYSYPVIYYMQNSEADISKGEVPFAGKRKYIALFTVKNAYENKIVVIDDEGNIDTDSGLSEQDIKNILSKLQKEYPNEYKEGAETTRLKTDFGIIWNTTRLIAKESPSIWSKTLKSLGIMGVVDQGVGIIHVNEPEQAVFFGKEVIEMLGVDTNQGRKKDSEEEISSSFNAYKAAKESKSNKVLNSLLNSKNEDILRALAGNPNISEEIALKVIQYMPDDYTIPVSLAHNPATTLKVAEVIIKDIRDGAKNILAKTKKANPNVLAVLAKSGDIDMRASVAANPKTSKETLKTLSSDENEGVRILADIGLKKLGEQKRYTFKEASHSTKMDATPRDQQIINRWEFPPEPTKKQQKWPYAAGQLNAMDPKNKAKRTGFGGMITAGKDEELESKVKSQAIYQIKMPVGKRAKAPGGDFGGSQGIQSMPTPHAKDNATSVGPTMAQTKVAGWSSSLPNKEFEPPVNNFGDKKVNDKKPVFKKLETKKKKKYKYIEPELYETEDDLSQIPDREKPQKVGQPLPVVGWTGGMDPLKKVGKK